MPRHLLGEAKTGGKMHDQGTLPVIETMLEKGHAHAVAGVVDEDVDGSLTIAKLPDPLESRIGVADVEDEIVRLDAGLAQFAGCPLCRERIASVDADDGSRFSESSGDGEPQTARRACDHGGPSCQGEGMGHGRFPMEWSDRVSFSWLSAIGLRGTMRASATVHPSPSPWTMRGLMSIPSSHGS